MLSRIWLPHVIPLCTLLPLHKCAITTCIVSVWQQLTAVLNKNSLTFIEREPFKAPYRSLSNTGPHTMSCLWEQRSSYAFTIKYIGTHGERHPPLVICALSYLYINISKRKTNQLKINLHYTKFTKTIVNTITQNWNTILEVNDAGTEIYVLKHVNVIQSPVRGNIRLIFTNVNWFHRK